MIKWILSLVLVIGFSTPGFSQGKLSKSDFNVVSITNDIDDMIFKLQEIKAKIRQFESVVAEESPLKNVVKTKTNKEIVEENLKDGTLYWDSGVGSWATKEYVWSNQVWVKRGLVRQKAVVNYIQSSNYQNGCPNGNCPIQRGW